MDIPSPSQRDSKQELMVSLNAQSQTYDIPGFSIRPAIAQYTTSLQVQTKEPDIPTRSLRVSKHELSPILNLDVSFV